MCSPVSRRVIKIQRLFSEFGYDGFQIKFESYRFVNACEMLNSIYIPVRCETRSPSLCPLYLTET